MLLKQLRDVENSRNPAPDPKPNPNPDPNYDVSDVISASPAWSDRTAKDDRKLLFLICSLCFGTSLFNESPLTLNVGDDQGPVIGAVQTEWWGRLTGC